MRNGLATSSTSGRHSGACMPPSTPVPAPSGAVAGSSERGSGAGGNSCGAQLRHLSDGGAAGACGRPLAPPLTAVSVGGPDIEEGAGAGGVGGGLGVGQASQGGQLRGGEARQKASASGSAGARRGRRPAPPDGAARGAPGCLDASHSCMLDAGRAAGGQQVGRQGRLAPWGPRIECVRLLGAPSGAGVEAGGRSGCP
jgi:hypothetical protein